METTLPWSDMVEYLRVGVDKFNEERGCCSSGWVGNPFLVVYTGTANLPEATADKRRLINPDEAIRAGAEETKYGQR